MDFKTCKLTPTPFGRANPISKVLFLWVLPIFKAGYNKELEQTDLNAILKDDEAKHVGDSLDKYWQAELMGCKLTGKKPSMLRALFKMSWKPLAVVTILLLINQCVIIVSQPVFLRLLIITFNDPDAELWKGYTWAAAVCLCSFINTLLTQPCIFEIMHISMKLRVATTSLIYRKSLRLSKSAENITSSGHIINLLSNDCTKFDINSNFLPYLVIAPIQLPIVMYLLYEQIGPSSLAGLGFIMLLLPLQYYLGKYSAVFRLQIALRADERSRVMNEIINGMRVIKQYAWEKPFSVLINGVRRLEMVEVRKRGMLRGLHHAVYTFAPKVVQYLTFLLFVLLEKEPMTAEKVFFAMTCLNTMIQITIHFTPLGAAGIGELLVAANRIQNFLELEEQNTARNLHFYAPTIIPIDKVENDCANNNNYNSHGMAPEAKRVVLENICANWSGDSQLALDNVSTSLEGDKLVMVVGPVGSAKTSLLNAILNELPILSGNITTSGCIAYASQEPWIFAGNLRQNILFGLPYDEQRYRSTLNVCALEEDLKQLPYGDMTVVGERGVALSGGQKARLNLARALYQKADIYLLDDPLSAVDSKVSRHLFTKCIKKHLRGSLTILVTHQLQYLPQADHIIVLNQGKILAQGSFSELVDAGTDLVGLLSRNDSTASVVSFMKQTSVTSEMDYSLEDVMGNQLDEEKPDENVEKKAAGSVNANTYWKYFTTGHKAFGFFILILTFLICQLLTSANDYWLSYWTNEEIKRMNLLNNVTICSSKRDKECENTYLGQTIYLSVYSAFVLSVTLLYLTRSLWFYLYCAMTSVTIHDNMFVSVVNAPIKFFDDNPSGRIMNRFTKDIGTIDEMLPPTLINTLTIMLQVFGVIAVVIISNFYMSVPTMFLLVGLYFLRRIFIVTARDVTRIECIARSPILTHVAATIQGLTTIRACKAENLLIERFEGLQDIHSSAWFTFMGANRCFGVWLELISNVFLVCVTFSFFLISSSEKGGNVGLAISSILSMMGAFQWGMRQSAETENYMTSVERSLEYATLEPEAPLDSESLQMPPNAWPTFGEITFTDLSLSYEVGKPVLRNLSFKILPSEKVGIVGRTGAGKSSIIAALFKLADLDGAVIIDSVNVNKIDLHCLRKNISIIPQDPVLFSGTVRYNLDPFNEFKDDHLWSVIEEVELKESVPSLDYHVNDGGTNFSVGQRQLVCLARAILRKNKILVMDEATANVDPGTDNLIQQTIRNKFSDCTIIIVAHRLHSIIECDRVLVLDHGQLKEYDHPHVLLQNENGIFSAMVAQTGRSTSKILKRLANSAFHDGNQEM